MGEATRVTPDCPGSLDRPDLARRSRVLQAAVLDRVLAAQSAGVPDDGLRLFGEGLGTIKDRLPLLERATRRSVYNLQRETLFDPLRREREPNRRSRSKGVHGHLITQPVDHLALVAACHPETWVGSVHMAGIAVDERIALFPGPPSKRGLPTAWLCTDQDLVATFCGIWEDTQRHAVPIWEFPGIIRLSERQVDIAALLSKGAKDTTIARLIGVSPRTVTSDIGRLLDAFGVSTRWEAGMVIGRASPAALAV